MRDRARAGQVQDTPEITMILLPLPLSFVQSLNILYKPFLCENANSKGTATSTQTST
jgi:hypothetical protein